MTNINPGSCIEQNTDGGLGRLHLDNIPANELSENYIQFVKTLDDRINLGDRQFSEVVKILEVNNDGNLDWCGKEVGIEIGNKYGTCRLEEWPEGLVLWVGGEIVYKSWKV